MKILLGLGALALSLSSFASTTDSKSFVYDGSQDSVELILNAEKTRTEYRVEDVRTTCFRQEVVGHRTVCSGGYYGLRRPHPLPYPRSCYSQPVYRTVSYPCVQTVRTPFEVKEYDVDARVIVDVTKLENVATPGEKITATLNGDNLTFSVKGSGKFFVVKNKQDINSYVSGAVKYIDGLLALELVEAAPVLEAIKVSNLSITKGVLSLNAGSTSKNLGLNVKVSKVKTFGSDTVLLDKDLSEVDYTITASSKGADVEVNLNDLGVDFSSGKYNITVKAFTKVNGNLMNGSDFKELSNSRTLIYKIR